MTPPNPRSEPPATNTPAPSSSPAPRAGTSTDPALGLSTLPAPWRLQYLEELSAAETAAGGAPSTGCFLRDYWLDPAADERNHVVVRTRSIARDGGTPRPPADDEHGGMILLNAYPYANGHLLVALGDGRPTLLDYTPDQRATLWRLVDTAAALMQASLEPQGINFGINQGRAAGAGVPGHLHVHLVPRWGGDVNFMTTVGRIRVIPGALDAMALRYRAAWDAIKADWPL